MKTDLVSSVSGSGERITESELERYDAPPATDTWFPLRHGHVLGEVKSQLGNAGFKVERQQLVVANKGARFFGTLDLSTPISDGVSLSVGVRNSNDKTFPIGFIAGNRVSICTNLSFSADLLVTRKHTRFGDERFIEALSHSVRGLGQYVAIEQKRVEWLQHAELTDDRANSLLLRAWEDGLVGTRSLPVVVKEWREPRHEEFRPRTAWSLLNAFTEVLKERQARHPAQAASELIRLQALLTEGATFALVA